MEELTRVLCAEDDADIRTVLKFSLTRVGRFEVCMCEDGFQALEKAPGFKPQLILLDVMMPGLSGPETFQKLREHPTLHAVPVIFVTAKATLDELEALSHYGAAGIIVKPFSANELPENVRMIWAGHPHARS